MKNAKRNVKNARSARKLALSQVKNLHFVTGLVAKEQKAKRAAGLTVTHPTVKVDTSLVDALLVKNAKNTLPVAQPPVPARSVVVEKAGVKKDLRGKGNESNN
jgi:hypothetical protein